jgi:uncharacterized phage protein (TIGR02218 family)
MSEAALLEHLASGETSVCRYWAVYRTDGRTFGFTDHDTDLAFEGIVFRADTGLSAQALQQGTGLSVDNSEALGALTDTSLTEEDIEAGRFDDTRVTSWLVNWAEPAQRMVTFSGAIGEIRRGAGAFRAELRGLTEALNQPQGMIYQRPCSAVLGDRRCRVDLDRPDYRLERPVLSCDRGRRLTLENDAAFEEGWFERGRIEILSGEGVGLVGIVKTDRIFGGERIVELWQAIQAPLAKGDRVRLRAGCDKRPETCQSKFSNYINFRGFPAIPGEDWLMAYPSSHTINDGGAA